MQEQTILAERSSDGMKTDRVVVIGGGLSGLAAAHRIHERARTMRRPVELTVLEAKDRLGGVLWTDRFDGFTLEGGPDSFITNKPWGIELCQRLGLSDQLIETDANHRRSFVVRNGRLVPVPEGFVLMAPHRLMPILTTPILSWRGKLRFLMDLVIPRRDDDGEESLAAFVRRRLGREALDRLVQPLVAGIYTADPNDLSLKATLPQFLAMEREHGSLILAGWRESRRRGGRGLERQASGRAVRDVRDAGRRHGYAPQGPGPGASRGNRAHRHRRAQNQPQRAGLALVDRALGRPAARGRRGDRRDRSPRRGPIPRFARPATGPSASRDPLCVVADRQHRLPARPDQPSARRLRRGRAGHRGPADPGGLVPEREVSQSGAGRDRALARFHRRRDPSRAVRPRRSGRHRSGPRASWAP